MTSFKTEITLAKRVDQINDHYGMKYFNDFQKKIGKFGGIANKFKFEKHISANDNVLDFGCGGGFLLRNLHCAGKVGVEINDVARTYCNTSGIKCYENLYQIEDGSIDVVISDHCLEHTRNPFDLIAELHQKLRPGGKLVIVVPLDSYQYRWKPHDINNHLYSFSPMNLGNILQGVGFKDIKTEPVLHKWVPFYNKVYSIFGYRVFNLLSWIYGRLNKHWVQVKAYGVK